MEKEKSSTIRLNSALGVAADLVVRNGANAILSEMTDFWELEIKISLP